MPAPARTIRVLLADDHTILREGIRSLLVTHPDITVVGEAKDGQEAIQKTLELNPDIVLMDISMPNVSGLEATRVIRQKCPNTRVLILTMHDSDEYIFQMLEAGASGYVLKGTASGDLVSAIQAVAEGQSFLYPSVAKKVVEEYLGRGTQPAERDKFDGLTEREVEVLRLVAEGKTNQEIADQLFLSVKTVQAHRAHIMEKLDLHDRVDLVKYALKKGLIKLES